MSYIWELKEWPNFFYDVKKIFLPLSRFRKEQRDFLRKISSLDIDEKRSAYISFLEDEAVHTSAIEGEIIGRDSVRSSILRHINTSYNQKYNIDKNADGLVQVLLDAYNAYNNDLTEARLFKWHQLIFSSGKSGLYDIKIGQWRDSPVQIISGRYGSEEIFYEAPPADKIEEEMEGFFHWWKKSQETEDGVVRAALSHLYFIYIHPFEDGNGRIARAITDMALAQDENLDKRLYSFSTMILKRRREYYNEIDFCQKSGAMECTKWILWFIDCLLNAIQSANKKLDSILFKIKFWKHSHNIELNEKQMKVINKILDANDGEFIGDLTNKKYCSMTKVSSSTALRDINDLLSKGILYKTSKNGRSLSYKIQIPSSYKNE